ncbi:MAG: hypothetical protein ACPLRH_01495 [Desulfotomaculales bacterium]
MGSVTLDSLVGLAYRRTAENEGGDNQNSQENLQNGAEGRPVAFDILDLLEAGRVVPPFACVIGQGISDAKKIAYYFWSVPLNWSIGEVVTFYLLGTGNSVAVNVRWRAVKKICERVASEYPGLLESVRKREDSRLFLEEAERRGLTRGQLLGEAREKALSYPGITQDEKKVLEGLFIF